MPNRFPVTVFRFFPVILIDMAQFLFPVLAFLLISEEEIRFTHTYKQGYDTSCGIAVTATLLNNFWNIPITEADMYQEMILSKYSEGDLNYAINFLTISDYLAPRGIQSRAYKMDWAALEDTLGKGFSPIIIHYERPRPHFALLISIYNNYAFVADPARGFVLLEKSQFERDYSGNVLLSASRTVEKNTVHIERVITEGTVRLNRLQDLSRTRGRW